MDGFSFVDIFATKGLEYLLVIGFLVLFVVFMRSLLTDTRKNREAQEGKEHGKSE